MPELRTHAQCYLAKIQVLRTPVSSRNRGSLGLAELLQNCLGDGMVRELVGLPRRQCRLNHVCKVAQSALNIRMIFR